MDIDLNDSVPSFCILIGLVLFAYIVRSVPYGPILPGLRHTLPPTSELSHLNQYPWILRNGIQHIWTPISELIHSNHNGGRFHDQLDSVGFVVVVPPLPQLFEPHRKKSVFEPQQAPFELQQAQFETQFLSLFEPLSLRLHHN